MLTPLLQFLSIPHRACYRPGIGLMVLNQEGRLLVAQRIHGGTWQFPQGGVDFKADHNLWDTAARELDEEVGLSIDDCNLLGVSDHWYSYQFPPHTPKRQNHIGQMHRWLLLQIKPNKEAEVCLRSGLETPEFKNYCWADYPQMLQLTRPSPRHAIYRQMLHAMAIHFPKPHQVLSALS